MVEPPTEFPVPSDKDAVLSTPSGDSEHLLLTVNRYAENQDVDWQGALIEETSAFRSDIELFYDLHTLLWDADTGQTLDCRNDAADSTVEYASSRVPEIHVQNEFVLADGSTATLTQRILASVETCGILIDARLAADTDHERTLYTVCNLGIKGHDHDDPRAVHEAYLAEERDGDYVVAHDEQRFLALAQQRADGSRGFDGCRIGEAGRWGGRGRSAWADVYADNDGWVDDVGYGRGNLDLGVGLYAGREQSVEWLTAVGFALDDEAAVKNARSLLDRGYDEERTGFADAWTDWHAGVRDGPTGDATADDLYEKSLTSMKCAQDACRAMVAGAFKPANMTYKFIWPRDQVIMIQALLAAGAYTEAREALQWLDDVQITHVTYDDREINRRGTWWQNYYTTGEPHWRALQLDQVGGPIYAHWLTWRETGNDAVLSAHYHTSKLAAEFLLAWDNGYGFPKRHQDPWEEVWGYSTEGTASAVAGLRCMAAMADARDESDFAARCRDLASTWADNLDVYCYREGTAYGDHYVTAASPESRTDPMPDARPDAAAFMAYWPWNVVAADHEPMVRTVELAADPRWTADASPCVGRYPGDRYTPSRTAEDGGWPLCEAYADVVRWQSGVDPDAVGDHVFEHAAEWTTAAGLLPERVAGDGRVRWNSNLQWTQATYVLLVESIERGEPFGMAPRE